MTYGAALPRIKPRPTLDNLREPQVPSAYSNTTTTTTSSPLPSSDAANHPQYTRQSSQSNNSLQQSDAYSVTDFGDQSRPSSRHNHTKTTDIFGYTSTSAANSREPSIAPTIFDDTAVTAPSPTHAKLSTEKKGKPPGKSKHRLHLSLGRLGRSKKEPPPEPARLREQTEIRISNPTFTRENLFARNYDAFFESGEPVYSLEYRTPLTTPVTSIDSDNLDDAYEDSTVADRPNSFGLFGRSPKPTVTFRSRSSDPMNRVAQKGDRCLLNKNYLICVSFVSSSRITNPTDCCAFFGCLCVRLTLLTPDSRLTVDLVVHEFST